MPRGVAVVGGKCAKPPGLCSYCKKNPKQCKRCSKANCTCTAAYHRRDSVEAAWGEKKRAKKRER